MPTGDDVEPEPAGERVASAPPTSPTGSALTRALARVRRLPARAVKWLRVRWSDVAFVLLAGSLVAWITWEAFNLRLVTASPSADYWEHSAAMRALIDDPLHPTNPHLVSPASSPRFVPLFILSALAARALGLDAVGAMSISASVHVLLLVLGIFYFFRTYFRDRRASLYGLIVMLASWYDAWHFSNVYQLKILFSVAGYPSTAGLALSLLGFTLSVRVLRRTLAARWLWALPPFWALVWVTHPLTAVLAFVGALLLAATEHGVPPLLRAKVGAAAVLGVLLSGLWPYYSVRGVLVGGGQEMVEDMVNNLVSGGERGGRLHVFYRQRELLDTLGFSLLGLPVSLYLLLRRRYLFIPLGLLATLVPFVVNAYHPLPLGHRFILLAVFFLQAGVVWLLLLLTPGAPQAWRWLTRGYRAWISAAIVAVSLAYPAYLNVLAAMGRVDWIERRFRGRESPNVRNARRIAELCGANAVILADAQTSWMLPTFGPKVLVIFHENPLVLDKLKRDADVKRFLRGAADSQQLEIARHYGVTHVLVSRAQARRLEGFLERHAIRHAVLAGNVLYVMKK